MGKSGRLEELYRRHAQAVFRFAYGLSRNRSQAEDIVAEVFVRVLTRADRIESATARAYLLAVARNVFLDERRGAARDAKLIMAMERNEAEVRHPADDRARIAHMLEALGALPEGERAALLLRLDHALPYEEIARALGISTAAAKVRVHRARLKLVVARKSGGWDDEG
ncbi:MAG: sigma-70 family RNA polymerase sigma factor [Parvularculaceae bacterium]|nr:sigma-70 family RNA polymerase sigma factor [Parvularculaceae bacterium]